MSRQEAIRKVEDMLSDYHIIGVRQVTIETGDAALAIYIRGSQSDAKVLLNDVTILGSMYVIAANLPFDAISVVVY